MTIESIFSSAGSDAIFAIPGLLVSLGFSLMMGLMISSVYINTHNTHNPSQSFSITLVVLPAVISVIILLVGNSVARAFSLAGAFSIIRFRSAPGDPKDITYVLISMALGLSCGMGYLLYSLVTAAVICGAIFLLDAVKYGQAGATGKLLKIVIPEDLDYAHAFDDILREHTTSYTLTRVKTTDLGSLFELQYEITQKPGSDEKAFIDELRCRNGNLNITLVLAAAPNDF